MSREIKILLLEILVSDEKLYKLTVFNKAVSN